MGKPDRRQVSLVIDVETINYFKQLAQDSGLSFQGLINFCLKQNIKQGWIPALVTESLNEPKT